jgi:putative sugar O-methyltransferase
MSHTSLTKAMDQLTKIHPLYKPTSFWEKACGQLAQEFASHGMTRFRQGKTALSYFVPTYAPPTLGINAEDSKLLLETLSGSGQSSVKSELALRSFLSGSLHALSDYRTFIASCHGSAAQLSQFTESKVGSPIEQFDFEGRHYSRSSLNYLLGLSFLSKHIDLSEIETVLEIGGGFGTLGEILLKTSNKPVKYIDVDIPPTHYAAEYYLREVFGKDNVKIFEEFELVRDVAIETLSAANVMCSWQIEKLQGKIDLFVNFISFQEMEPEVVQNYLRHIDRLESKWILLRNLREGKQIRTQTSAGVQKPLLTEHYISYLANYELINRNVVPFGYRTVDVFHSELLIFKRKPSLN